MRAALATPAARNCAHPACTLSLRQLLLALLPTCCTLMWPVPAAPPVRFPHAGVILYMLLSGRPPFSDESLPRLYKAIEAGACPAGG